MKSLNIRKKMPFNLLEDAIQFIIFFSSFLPLKQKTGTQLRSSMRVDLGLGTVCQEPSIFIVYLIIGCY